MAAQRIPFAAPWLLGCALASTPAAAGPYDDPGYAIATMAAWATSVEQLVRGPMDIDEPEIGYASYGLPEDAVGPALGDTYTTVSLGDGGSITLQFASGIADVPGNDFAVFENGFFAGGGGLFAEFAFVEVSSNGTDFARFDSSTLQTTPVAGQSAVDPTDYYNLAGDQERGLGTGFDLAQLSDHALVTGGVLDLADVRYVRLVDVIGNGSTTDVWGNPVYDPYPTLFYTGGFDLDGIGVLHPVPEPGELALLACGLGALLALRRPLCLTAR
jgi:hypothetical protein